MPLALIDADSIYFKACYGARNKRDVKKRIDSTMLEILGQCFCDDGEYRVALKGRDNYRTRLYKPYKANRKPLEEDMKKLLNMGHEHMKKKWNGVEATGMEADDLVSIWAYEAREMEIDYIICGIDKDLKQIPGNHYNYNKLTFDFVDDDKADMNLMVQCLTGDNTDNIPGIKGIGPKKAEKILKDIPYGSRWGVIQKTWQDMSAGDPTMSLKLLSMLKTWEEFEETKDVGKEKPRSEDTSETPECEQDVQSEGEDDVQIDGLSDVSGRDS